MVPLERATGLPIELEVEEESVWTPKRLKLIAPLEQCYTPERLEGSSTLGLSLRKTQSFLNLLEAKLTDSSFLPKPKSVDAAGKTKASNFSASLLRIGSWERYSRFEWELVAKCYYAKRKLVWEVLEGGLKSKIEFQWSTITSLRATCNGNEPDILEIELSMPPIFFNEMNPQPKKHTLWKPTSDFTGGQASIYRRHFLQFPQGILGKHYEKLLHLDNRLSLLSKRPFPSSDFPFFGSLTGENQIQDEPNSFLVDHSSVMLNPLTVDDYSQQLQDFSLTRTLSVSQELPELEPHIAFAEITSPISVIDLPSVLDNGASDYDEQQLLSIPNWQGISTSSQISLDQFLLSGVIGTFPAATPVSGNISTGFSYANNRTLEAITREPLRGQTLDIIGLCGGEIDSSVHSMYSLIDSDLLIPDSGNSIDWNLDFTASLCRAGLGDSTRNQEFNDGLSWHRLGTGKAGKDLGLDFQAILSSLPAFSVGDPAVSDESGRS